MKPGPNTLATVFRYFACSLPQNSEVQRKQSYFRPIYIFTNIVIKGAQAMANIDASSIDTSDGPLQEILDNLAEQNAAIIAANNDLIEEVDIVRSENAELARNQRYLAKTLGKLLSSLTKNGGGVELKDGNVTIYPAPEVELVWEETDLFASMTKFRTGRETLIELFGGKCNVENWPQLREAAQKRNDGK
jgi:hypothetical protein